MWPEPHIFEEIAIELGVDPAFVEKDWYATQVLKAIAAIPPGPITPVFSGGTCLSKAYKLIKRFSEDLDFRGYYTGGNPSKPVAGNPSRSIKRQFREKILVAVEGVDGVNLDRDKVKFGSSYFKFPLSYTNAFATPGSLRPDLLVEFSFTQPRNACDTRATPSFVSEFSNAEPEAEILCLSPTETAADKFCALAWRVIKRDRSNANDDPAMIRHLHDLYALRHLIEEEPQEFIDTVIDSFRNDMALNSRRLDYTLVEAAKNASGMLQEDKLYAEEYAQFVTGMSYAPDDERISFGTALANFVALIIIVE
jgi:hypothetical protein